MDFNLTARASDLKARLEAFMAEHVYPNEAVYAEQLERGGRWNVPEIVGALKIRARREGLWNLFMPDDNYGAGLTNLEYAPICEVMGRSLIAPELFNCNAPDSGNMETIHKYGSDEHKETWLKPLLDGDIRSSYCMTEPDVASSDATNIAMSIVRDGDEYVLNGRKWWSTGGGDKRCKLLVVMGLTYPDAAPYKKHSMILVPRDATGVTIVRNLSVYGYDHAPKGHWEIDFYNVRVPAGNILLGPGRGFEIAQGRLGPGRIHHCMRLIGMAERALEMMCQRAKSRVAFGAPLSDQGAVRDHIAISRMEIDQARLLTLYAAHKMDTVGNKEARSEIAQIKIVAPKMATAVIDRAVQLFGGAGVSADFFLSAAWAQARITRIADGPDAVHLQTVGKHELMKTYK